MRRLINILLFTVLATIGCRKENLVIDGGVQVSINMSSVDISQTKTSLKLKDVQSTVRVLVYNSNSVLIHNLTFIETIDGLKPCTVAANTYTGTQTAGDNTIYLPSAGEYSFYTISPAMVVENGKINVDKRDRDLLFSNTTWSFTSGAEGPHTVKLKPLKHMHSQIQMAIDVKFVGSKPEDVKLVDIGDGGVIFSNQTNVLDVTGQEYKGVQFDVIPGKFGITAANHFDDFKFAKDELKNQQSLVVGEKEYKSDFKTLFPRPSSPSFVVSTNIKVVNNLTILTSAPLEMAFVSGMQYTLKMHISDSGTLLYLEVQRWVNPDENSWNSNFGGSITYFLGGWEGNIVELAYNTDQTAGYIISPTWVRGNDWKGDFDGTIFVEGDGWETVKPNEGVVTDDLGE